MLKEFSRTRGPKGRLLPGGRSGDCCRGGRRGDCCCSLKKRGRPLLLGQELDPKVQLYQKNIRDGGGVVSARITVAAARDILLKSSRTKFAEFVGHVKLSRHWAHSLLHCMKFIQRKATTAKSKETKVNSAKLKKSILADVVATVTIEEMLHGLILS